MRFRTICSLLCFAALAPALGATASAQGPIRFSTEDGASSVSLGVLLQPQFDWEDRGDGTSAWSAGLRRARLIAGGRLFQKVKFFVESDSPYFGVHSSSRTVDHEIFLQDLVVTYEARRGIQVDAGLIMVPLSYNTNQSAASLLGVNYGPYSFLASGPTTSKVGRDWGTQVRGYLAGGHVEYRAGVFEGVREIDPSAPRRFAGRVAWYPLDTQDGLFYTGTTLGKKHLLAIGGGFDRQDDYAAHSVDVFYDRPLGGGNSMTVQLDLIRYDGGTTFTKLPKQNAWLFEGGYYFGRPRLGVFTQLGWQDVVSAAAADATSYAGGVAWFARGHRLTLKAAVARIVRDGAPDRVQLFVQSQVFAF